MLKKNSAYMAIRTSLKVLKVYYFISKVLKVLIYVQSLLPTISANTLQKHLSIGSSLQLVIHTTRNPTHIRLGYSQ